MSQDTRFSVDYSKRTSKCKRCKKELAKGSIRLAKVVPNFFAGGDNDEEMKNYFHIECLFESFKRARASTKKIEAIDDIENVDSISKADKNKIIEIIEQSSSGETAKSASKSSASKKNDDSDSEDESEAKKSKKPSKNER